MKLDEFLCRQDSAEFGISTFLVGLFGESFSTFRVDSVYDASMFCCFSDLQLFWESDLTIGEVADKNVNRSIWADVYHSSAC